VSADPRNVRRARNALVGNHAGQLGFINQDSAGFGPLVARDDAAALEHVDQPSCTRIADTQTALEQTRGGRLGCDDDLDRPLEQRVLVGVELTVVVVVLGRRFRRLEQALVQLLLALGAALLNDQCDLFLADVGALEALKT
jgi:hypothetical protein